MGFKPKDTELRIDVQRDVVFNRDQFLEDVFNDDYILVVGNEVIMNTDEEPTGDVKKYILGAVNSKLNRDYKDFNELVRHTGDIDVVRNLLNSTEFSYELSDLSPELVKLLETKLFRIVLTTTFDGYLNELMKHVWGEGNYRIVNIYNKKSLDLFENTLKELRDTRRYKEPTLFYIFGQAVADESKKYVRTDDDAIKIIEKWIQMPKDYPYIRNLLNKHLLALGCKFDNWYFRFFWYTLKGELSRFREGQVAFKIDTSNVTESRLSTFLKQSKIYRHESAKSFMTSFIKDIEHHSDGSIHAMLIKKNRKHGGVFISYCSKDFVIANNLFFTLNRLGYKVWFDNDSLQGGANYKREIEEAIGKTKVFIPILSPNVAEDMTNANTNNYYNREWNMAQQFNNMIIIPLAVNGYNLRESYHTDVFENIITRSASGVNLMDNDGLEQLQKAIDKYLM